jgi:hypothetical protein
MKSGLLALAFVVGFGGWAAGQDLRYDKAKETTISGPIRYVLAGTSQDGVVGVHVEVKTPSGLVRVALGPALFIASNNYYFFMDESVSIVGAKVGPAGEIWARTITKDGKNVLVLRDEDGTPRWDRASDDDPDGCGVSHAPIR